MFTVDGWYHRALSLLTMWWGERAINSYNSGVLISANDIPPLASLWQCSTALWPFQLPRAFGGFKKISWYCTILFTFVITTLNKSTVCEAVQCSTKYFIYSSLIRYTIIIYLNIKNNTIVQIGVQYKTFLHCLGLSHDLLSWDEVW